MTVTVPGDWAVCTGPPPLPGLSLRLATPLPQQEPGATARTSPVTGSLGHHLKSVMGTQVILWGILASILKREAATHPLHPVAQDELLTSTWLFKCVVFTEC